jgi:hypothetical protein
VVCLKEALATLLSLAVMAVPAQGHVKGCHSRKCDRRVSEKRHRNYWVNRWKALPYGARRWTRCVSTHESGNRRIARESGFLSYFQWVGSTWHMAGGSGNPETHSWYEQAVKAWPWHVSHPYGQWPNTGERGRCGS